MRKQSHNGFTLVELLVVLAVIAIISSISFGAFKSISQGNKRTSCQSNLAQIYKSVRLYAQDYEGRLPYLNENGDQNMPYNSTSGPSTYGGNAIAATPKGGIGLWALYTFGKPGFENPSPLPLSGDNNCPAIQDPDPTQSYEMSVDLPAQVEDQSDVKGGFVGLTGYVRSAKIFHCPADNYSRNVQFRDLTDDKAAPTYQCQSVKIDSPTLLIKDGSYNYLNPSYLSYQVTDDYPLRDSGSVYSGNPTYSSFRKPEETNTGFSKGIKYRQISPYKLSTNTSAGQTQLVDRTIKDMTVLTWCRFHRSLDEKGGTIPTKRVFDNVLFSDGSVQSLPAEQNVVQEETGNTGTCVGWQRVPREKAEHMSKDYAISDCVPTP